MTRVPGCVSVVHVGVELRKEEVSHALAATRRPRESIIHPPPHRQATTSQPQTTTVHVRGVSDARLSQGLMAAVAQGLTGADPKAVLALEPEELATVRTQGHWIDCLVG